MKKSKLSGAIAVGGGLKYPIVPSLILGDVNNGYNKGDILDANSISLLIKNIGNISTNQNDNIFKKLDGSVYLFNDENISNLIINKNNTKYNINGTHNTILGSSITYNNKNGKLYSTVSGNNNYFISFGDINGSGSYCSGFSVQKGNGNIINGSFLSIANKKNIINKDLSTNTYKYFYNDQELLGKLDFDFNSRIAAYCWNIKSDKYPEYVNKKFSKYVLVKSDKPGENFKAMFDGVEVDIDDVIVGNSCIGNSNLISGNINRIEGDLCITIGQLNQIKGNSSSAFGDGNVINTKRALVSGMSNAILSTGSISVGQINFSHKGSVASSTFGNFNVNYGRGSICSGNYNITHNIGQSSFGNYNLSTPKDNYENKPKEYPNNPTEATLFSIGNGTSEDSRSNALEVKYNGDTYISGDLYFNTEHGTRKPIFPHEEVSEENINENFKDGYVIVPNIHPNYINTAKFTFNIPGLGNKTFTYNEINGTRVDVGNGYSVKIDIKMTSSHASVKAIYVYKDNRVISDEKINVTVNYKTEEIHRLGKYYLDEDVAYNSKDGIIRITLRTADMSKNNPRCYAYNGSYKLTTDFPGKIMKLSKNTVGYNEWIVDLECMSEGIYANVLPTNIIFKFENDELLYEKNTTTNHIYII